MIDWRRRALEFRSGRIELELGEGPRDPRFVLLIHGYNVDRSEAEEAYSQALDKLRGKVDGTLLREKIWGLFWPGYSVSARQGIGRYFRNRVEPGKEGGKKAFLSWTTYPQKVGVAREVGRALGEYLFNLKDRYGNPSQVILIAHSLGCRVAVEALNSLFTNAGRVAGSTRVPAVCLMAAAVPQEMFCYLRRFWWVVHLPRRMSVLYSRKDGVLMAAFPGGQTAAGSDEGFFPEAVGRHGKPGGWTASGETLLDHGMYWGSHLTSWHLAETLGVLGVRHLPESVLSTWDLPHANEVGSRAIPVFRTSRQ